VCKGWDHLFKEFTSLGINFNAETHDDRVIFYWKGLDEEITKLLDRKEGLKILGRTPSREEFENEKKIVLQEYDDSFSDPQDALFTNIGRKYFNNYGPIGFRKDLEETSYEQMVEFILKNFSSPTRNSPLKIVIAWFSIVIMAGIDFRILPGIFHVFGN